jgi:hypothetical protein
MEGISMLKILVFVSVCAANLSAQVPQVKTIQPEHGKIGTVLQANGRFLDKDKVDSVYLADEKLDLMVKVLRQDQDTIEFRIPPSVKPGRLQLIVKMVGEKGLMLQQPIFVQVEEGTAAPPPMVAEAK